MTFEIIKSKIEKSKTVSIVKIGEIPHGKFISLNNGCRINCFNSGTYNLQGRGREEIQAILDEKDNRKIFIVYGHDEIARTQLEVLLRRWGLEPIILDQQVSCGQTIIEKLEEYSKDVESAIILATPDDDGKAKTEETYKSRVRQNVVLELGMFLAKLGRDRVIILRKETADFENPSDIDGLIYIPFQNKVDDIALNLMEVLIKQGYKIELIRN